MVLFQETIEMPNTDNFLMMFLCACVCGGGWRLIVFFLVMTSGYSLSHLSLLKGLVFKTPMKLGRKR